MGIYGCHNKPREAKPLLVQDGWIVIKHEYSHEQQAHFTTRRPLMREIPYVNSTDCRYEKQATDKGCKDCKHVK